MLRLGESLVAEDGLFQVGIRLAVNNLNGLRKPDIFTETKKLSQQIIFFFP